MTERAAVPYLEIDSSIDFAAEAEKHMGEGGLFLYDAGVLETTAKGLLEIEMPYGMTVRYAAKANPHRGVVRLFDDLGLHFDASSLQEAQLLVDDGVDPGKVSVSSQVLDRSDQLEGLVGEGLKPVATALRQIGMLGEIGCANIAVRVNAGIGSGHDPRTNVAGPNSSFGIWHEDIEEIIKTANAGKTVIDRLHTHIGSGADTRVWRKVIKRSLDLVDLLPDVTTLDIGGGYKVARMPGERAANMTKICAVFAEELLAFEEKTGRQIGLEIEPGSHLVANAGTLLGRVKEINRTPKYEFLRLNVGMNALIRPSMYGAQHPIEVLNDADETGIYAVVGPCCESGDILTPAPGDPKRILPRELSKAEIGDVVAIGGAGAYGPTMAARKYNHVPEATEVIGHVKIEH